MLILLNSKKIIKFYIFYKFIFIKILFSFFKKKIVHMASSSAKLADVTSTRTKVDDVAADVATGVWFCQKKL